MFLIFYLVVPHLRNKTSFNKLRLIYYMVMVTKYIVCTYYLTIKENRMNMIDREAAYILYYVY